MARSGSGEPEVHRITAANKPHSDDLDARIGRYLLSMLIRTVCFILMFAVQGPMRWVFAAGAVFLPYVAVIFANAGGTRREAGPPPVAPPGRRQLEARQFDPAEVRVVRGHDVPLNDVPVDDGSPDVPQDPPPGDPTDEPADDPGPAPETAPPHPSPGYPPNG